MLWKFDAFFAPSPEKIETTSYEDKDDTPREDLPPDEDEDDETISGDERTKRADLQSASFSHLDTLPSRLNAKSINMERSVTKAS